MCRIDNLMNAMSLTDKIAQLTGGAYGKLIDIRKCTIKNDYPKEYWKGIGYMTRLGGSNDLLPQEVAHLTNEIQRYFIENTKHKIPVLFLTEATSGTLAREHTVFPGNLNVGAMFNDDLTYQMSTAIREEMIAVGERYALAPVVDIIRDHRYGRYEESYSEDVYLASQNGISYVKGLQSENLKSGVAATLKHFAAQGISDGGRNTAPIHLGDRELLDQYIAPFEACIKNANPATIMAAYHELDGLPCHASKKLLTDILRNKMGYEGIIISDGNGISLLKDYQEYCKDLLAAAVCAVDAGVEVELDTVYRDYLEEALEKGLISVDKINNACRKVLELKEKLGLFDNPYVEELKVDEIVQCAKHLSLSYQMALESIILLKNDNNILPIQKNKYKKIAVVGPMADQIDFGYGDYSYPTHIREMFEETKGLPEEEIIARSGFIMSKGEDYNSLFHKTKIILDEIRSRFCEAEIIYEKCLEDTYNYKNDPNFKSIQATIDKIKNCDIIFAICGDRSGMGGSNDTGESVDRVEITLAKEQQEMLLALSKLDMPIVLILTNGRPFELSAETVICDAIIETFRAGQMGAKAICDVLLGDYNPSGKLPVTLPKHLGQLPVYYSQRPSGHKQFWRNTYLEMDTNPLYEFGFGLSYTDFTYSNFNYMTFQDYIQVEFTITNSGSYAGHEVPQIYISKKYTSVVQPELELKAYKKIFLDSGQSIELIGVIYFDSLGYHNLNMEFVLENCDLTISIGSSSKKIHFHRIEPLLFDGGKRFIKDKVFTNKLFLK